MNAVTVSMKRIVSGWLGEPSVAVHREYLGWRFYALS
jgi:putative transposon-encoded protein